MTAKEQKIAEIREKHSTGHYNYNYEVRDAIQFLLDELERVNRERDKLIEVLRWYADPKHWYGDETFCPPEGISTEEDCGQRARDILHEIGVTVE